MGTDKALLPWRSETFLASAIRALQPFTEMVIVVAGANEDRLAPTVYANAAFLARNPAPEQGQFSSWRVGLAEVLDRGRDAALVTLVDRPAPSLEVVRQIKQEFLRSGQDIWAVVPEYEGRHGHPIAIGRELIDAFLRAPATGDARAIEHAHQEHIRYLPVADPLVTANINTPEDYRKLQTGQSL